MVEVTKPRLQSRPLDKARCAHVSAAQAFAASYLCSSRTLTTLTFFITPTSSRLSRALIVPENMSHLVPCYFDCVHLPDLGWPVGPGVRTRWEMSSMLTRAGIDVARRFVKNVHQTGQLLASRIEAQHQSKTPFPENSFSASVIPQSCKLCFSSLLRHEGFDTLDLRENSSIGRRASVRIDPKLALTLPTVSDSFFGGLRWLYYRWSFSPSTSAAILEVIVYICSPTCSSQESLRASEPNSMPDRSGKIVESQAGTQ